MVSGRLFSQSVTRVLSNGSNNLFKFWHEGRGPLVDTSNTAQFWFLLLIYDFISDSLQWPFNTMGHSIHYSCCRGLGDL